MDSLSAVPQVARSAALPLSSARASLPPSLLPALPLSGRGAVQSKPRWPRRLLSFRRFLLLLLSHFGSLPLRPARSTRAPSPAPLRALAPAPVHDSTSKKEQ